MSNSDKYKAIIRPVPTLVGSEILWGWDVTLTDKYDDKTYPFSEGPAYQNADDALQAGSVSMIKWMQALSVVADKGVSEVNLDASIPEPVVEETPETPAEPETEAAAEEKLEEAVDNAPEAPAPAPEGTKE